MKFGIMQSYFFPYMGHFALIANTRKWVVFDDAQYTPRSWMTRNRVLHPKEGWSYINVPLQNASISLRSSEILVQNVDATLKSILGKISHYRRHAPHYHNVVKLIEEAFSRTRSDSLVSLNTSCLETVCHYIGIDFDYTLSSEIALPQENIEHAGSWAVEICRQLGATSYLNPEGGRELFHPEDFSKHGIDLEFLSFSEFVYDTGPFAFEPNLSILDVLMWNSPEQVKTALIDPSIVTVEKAL